MVRQTGWWPWPRAVTPGRERHPAPGSVPNSHRRRSIINELELAHDQLTRMRGMTRYYHDRFFADTRHIVLGVIALTLLGFWAVPEAFLLIPVVALLGANQTAFDASYLFMARRYAAALEQEINGAMRRSILVGAELEDRYLVPLDSKRAVGVAFGNGFTWFGWMTVLYTSLGILAFSSGIWLGWDLIEGTARLVYLMALSGLTLASLLVGWWWFVTGEGQSRLDDVIDRRFARRSDERGPSHLRGGRASNQG
jgi:hypothetical protein